MKIETYGKKNILSRAFRGLVPKSGWLEVRVKTPLSGLDMNPEEC